MTLARITFASTDRSALSSLTLLDCVTPQSCGRAFEVGEGK
jgi:hypothetical protein